MPPLPPPDLPQPGDTVATKYRIDGTLGVGGMGVVMAATDTSLNRPVAIKFLSRAKVGNADAILRFQREARAAASLQGENVVRILEVSELPSGEPFIVMEYLRGHDLSDVVTSRGGLPIPEATEYILMACEALAEAHGRGIVHRDLKPQNLFLTDQPDGSAIVKMLDFGIARFAGAAEDIGGSSDLTRTDTVLGTPLYMSPEQIRSLKNVDHRADIWALGVILFELLCAAPVFDAPTPSALCAMIVVDPPNRLSERRPDAPAEIEAIILRCLEKDPRNRFQDVAALALALRPFTSDRGRLSADRVARVLSSGPARANAIAVPMSDPSLAPTAHAGMDPQRIGATDSVWTDGRGTGDPRRGHTTSSSSGGTIAVVLAAVFTGVLLLAASAGAFLYLRGREGSRDLASPPITSAQPVPPVAEPSTTARGAALVTASASAVATPPSSSAPSRPASPRAPSASASTAPSAKPSASAAEDARKKRKALSDSNVLMSRNWAQADNWPAAKMAVCFNANRPDGTNAERAQCRIVCTKLDDKMCLMDMDGADRQWPASM